MKPLLSKTTRPFLIYVLIVLLISIPVYYFVIEKIWVDELDEHNKIVAQKTEAAFNKIPQSTNELKDNIHFWNTLQPGVFLSDVPPHEIIKDSIFTADAKSPYIPKEAGDNFRVLITTIKINNQPYYFRSVTSFEDTRETVTAIALVTFIFFICILMGLLILNRNLSKTVWKPFRNTLGKLRSFNLNKDNRIDFDKTDITEFHNLNDSLSTLVAHTIAVYKTQKEFTENASHELQTPLAILKNKLDLLLQTDNLSGQQYQIADEMHKAVIRSSRINKNLLLLASIDNSRFDNAELIPFDVLLQQSMDALQEHFEQKNIAVTLTAIPDVQVHGNSNLAEVLINNLLLNAIRHTAPNGSITIQLSNTVFEVANSGLQELNAGLLFKRFSRQSADNGGSGLGLAIVKEICGFHNWSVQYKFEGAMHIFSVYF